jgi:hypothetical protein
MMNPAMPSRKATNIFGNQRESEKGNLNVSTGLAILLEFIVAI